MRAEGYVRTQADMALLSRPWAPKLHLSPSLPGSPGCSVLNLWPLASATGFPAGGGVAGRRLNLAGRQKR